MHAGGLGTYYGPESGYTLGNTNQKEPNNPLPQDDRFCPSSAAQRALADEETAWAWGSGFFDFTRETAPLSDGVTISGASCSSLMLCLREHGKRLVLMHCGV